MNHFIDGPVIEPIALGDCVRLRVLVGSERSLMMTVVGLTQWLDGDAPTATVRWVDAEGEVQSRDVSVYWLTRVVPDEPIGFARAKP